MHFGDITSIHNRITIHPSQAGNQLRLYYSKILQTSLWIVGSPWPMISDCVSMGAAYDSQERDTAPWCHPGTRRGILKRIEKWVKARSGGTSVLWLHGPAGAGKSVITQTVAETCAGRHQLTGTFFFARTVAGRNSIRYLFLTIAVQIAFSAPEKRQRLDKILNGEPYIVEHAWGSLDLMASLFQDCSKANPSPLIVIIDGLDECQGHNDQLRILAEVSCMVKTHHLPLRFVIVSRPESHLYDAFEEPSMAIITKSLSLYDDFWARVDVSSYLRSEFSRIHDSKRHKYVMQLVPTPWPSEDAIQKIVHNSWGYFIYVSTVIKFVDEENFLPTDRLCQVLNSSNSSNPPGDSAPFAELDKLYLQIISLCQTSNLPILKVILGYIVVPHLNPLHRDIVIDLDDIESFLHLPRGQVKLMLRKLRSLVTFGESLGDVELLTLHHASFENVSEPRRTRLNHAERVLNVEQTAM